MTKKKKKRKVGRPTKYSKAILKKAERYIMNCKDNIEKFLESTNKKTGRKRFKYRLKVSLPKAEGLALYLEVSRDTLYEWARKYKEFSYILERINQIQADRVIDKALVGDYNPLIAKLLLGKHGYKDRQDITSGDKPIPILGGNVHPNNSDKKNKETEKED